MIIGIIGRKASLADSERKRNRSAISSKWNKCRIYVGDQLDRWNELKEALRVQAHAEVANTLLFRTDLHKMKIKHRIIGKYATKRCFSN
jgi:hypothetical protein